LLAFARPSPQELLLGVAVSRRVRGAVVRNRARRRVREALRHRLLSGSPALPGLGYEVVVIARPAALTAPMMVLERDVEAMARQLESASGK
jgi:ribonuclease P protein component